MSLLDVLLAVILVSTVISGFLSGFARGVVGFAATIAGMIAGFWFYRVPARFLETWIHSPGAANFIGFFVILIAFIVAGSLVGHLLARLLKWIGLSPLDRILGACFGLVRGGLIFVAFVAVLMAFLPRPLPNWMADSAVLPYAIDASDMCASLAPKDLKDAFQEGVREVHDLWERRGKKTGHV